VIEGGCGSDAGAFEADACVGTAGGFGVALGGPPTGAPYSFPIGNAVAGIATDGGDAYGGVAEGGDPLC
jgi:hypothetical protein